MWAMYRRSKNWSAHTMVGTHRRVYFRDLIEYKRRRDAERRKAIDEMTALAEELDVYD